MLYATISLALALAHKPTEVLLAHTTCKSDFSSCSNNVDRSVAMFHHIKALRETHGVLANSQKTCSGTKALEKGDVFVSTLSVPLVGEQTTKLHVHSMEGSHGVATLSAHGIVKFDCAGIAFEKTGSSIKLQRDLHSACNSMPKDIKLSKLDHCANQDELHAKIETRYVDLHAVAAKDVSAKGMDDEYCASGNDSDCANSMAAASAFGAICDPDSKMCVPAPDPSKAMCYCNSADGGPVGSFSVDTCADCDDAKCNSKLGSTTLVKGSCTGGGGSDDGGGGDGGDSNGGGGDGCFDKDSTTACLLASPLAECEHVLMADLVPGDLVLGRDGATTVVAVQHKAVDTVAEMLTFHTAAASVSMTPNHAIFVDGELVAANDVKVGSLLSTGAVKRITKSEGNIINPVTASGTIVADGTLAASNPMWIASLTVDAPITRAVVNAALFAAGDVDSIADGAVGVLAMLAKIAATLAAAAATAKALNKRSSK